MTGKYTWGGLGGSMINSGESGSNPRRKHTYLQWDFTGGTRVHVPVLVWFQERYFHIHVGIN